MYPPLFILRTHGQDKRTRRRHFTKRAVLAFQKHVDRLRKVGGTEFVRYEKESGTWVFKVPHFTTYGFDYDDDASVVSEGDKQLQSSMLSEAPPTPTPKPRGAKTGQPPTTNGITGSLKEQVPEPNLRSNPAQESRASSILDDTFHFRRKKMIPGSFDEETIVDDDQEDDYEMEEVFEQDQSFLDERLVSPSDSGEDEPSEHRAVNEIDDRSLVVRGVSTDEEEDEMELEMAGAFPEELEATKLMVTPGKVPITVTGDWADELQRTISPRKQNRKILREAQIQIEENSSIDEEQIPKENKAGTLGKASSMATHMDLMDSLWGQDRLKRSGRQGKQPAKAKGLKV